MHPATDYYRDRRRKDGLTLYCRTCSADIERDRPPRTPTARRWIRRIAYRRAERDLRRLHPADFEAFYASHVAAGIELADRYSDDDEFIAALKASGDEDE